MKTPRRPNARAFQTVKSDMPQKQTTRIKLQHKQRLRNRFQFLKTLGEGTYGKVKLAADRSTGREVAIKSIRKRQIQNEADLNRIRREIDIMSSVSHPHIIPVFEVFENDDKIVIVMEYARGGELYDYINDKGGLTDDEARKFFRQIVSAVHYLHENGVVHRDLKLENIVLDEYGNAQIADFGLSNYYSFETMLRTFCGSPLYASPEIVNGQQYYGPEVDCWSLGVLLYTLVYGAMPFDGSDFKKLRKQISRADYYEPSNPSDAAGLIKHLLTVNPSKRASVNEAAHHWWVNLGYKHTPIYEEEIDSFVNIHHVDPSVSLALSSDSDCDLFDREQGNSLDTVLRVASPQGILRKPTGLTNFVIPNEKELLHHKATEKNITEYNCTKLGLSNHKTSQRGLSFHVATELRSTNRKGTEKRLSEHKSTEKRLSECKGTEKRLSEHKSTEKRLSECKGTEKRLSEHKSTEKRLSECKGTEKKLSECKGTMKRLSACKGPEKRLSERKGTEKRLSECKSTEKRLSECKELESNPYPSSFPVTEFTAFCTMYNQSSQDDDEGIVSMDNTAQVRTRFFSKSYESVFDAKKQPRKSILKNRSMETKPNLSIGSDQYETDLSDSDYYSKEQTTKFLQSQDCHIGFEKGAGASNVEDTADCNDDLNIELYDLSDIEAVLDDDTYASDLLSLNDGPEEEVLTDYLALPAAQELKSSTPIKYDNETQLPVVQEVQLSIGSVVQEAPHSKGSVVQEVPLNMGSVVQEAPHSMGSVVQEVPLNMGSVVQEVPHSRVSLFDHAQPKGILNYKGKINQNLDVLSRSAALTEDLQLFCSHGNCEQENSNLTGKDTSRLNRPEIVVLKDIVRENHCLSQFDLDSNLFSMQCSLRDQLTEKLDRLNKPHCSFPRDNRNQLFDLVEARSVYKEALQFCSQ